MLPPCSLVAVGPLQKGPTLCGLTAATPLTSQKVSLKIRPNSRQSIQYTVRFQFPTWLRPPATSGARGTMYVVTNKNGRTAIITVQNLLLSEAEMEWHQDKPSNWWFPVRGPKSLGSFFPEHQQERLGVPRPTDQSLGSFFPPEQPPPQNKRATWVPQQEKATLGTSPRSKAEKPKAPRTARLGLGQLGPGNRGAARLLGFEDQGAAVRAAVLWLVLGCPWHLLMARGLRLTRLFWSFQRRTVLEHLVGEPVFFNVGGIKGRPSLRVLFSG